MVLGVGYVADNPGIEDALLRKGIYGTHEDELLAAFAAAMVPQRKGAHHNASDAHIILGFEPERLARSITQAETTDAFWLDDPRFATITAMIKRLTRNPGGSSTDVNNNTGSIIANVRSSKFSRHDARVTIATRICQRLARLLSFDVKDVVYEDGRSVASYGLDSMIGTEFRNWLFKEFGSDIPYQRLLAPNLTIMELAEDLYETISQVQKLEDAGRDS
ncbi:MAG: hypothetical protein Q9198_000994 [Flavoplaca austrocitrina]